MAKEITRTQSCNVCSRHVLIGGDCDQPKNGYCILFRLQAKIDQKAVNMAQPKNPHYEEIRGKF